LIELLLLSPGLLLLWLRLLWLLLLLLLILSLRRRLLRLLGRCACRQSDA